VGGVTGSRTNVTSVGWDSGVQWRAIAYGDALVGDPESHNLQHS
jgi:hypothetical protein